MTNRRTKQQNDCNVLGSRSNHGAEFLRGDESTKEVQLGSSQGALSDD